MKKNLPLLFILFSIISAQAGLKEWIHGTPPPATPGVPEAKAAAVTFSTGVASDKPVLDFMQALAEAYRLHDGTALKPRLAAKFAMEEIPSDLDATDVLMRGIAQTKAPNEIVINSIESASDVRIAKVEFRSADRPPKTRTFRFDAEGKLLSCDLFKAQRHSFSN